MATCHHGNECIFWVEGPMREGELGIIQNVWFAPYSAHHSEQMNPDRVIGRLRMTRRGLGGLQAFGRRAGLA